MIDVPKTLRVFFVQFLYKNYKTNDGEFMVSAQNKEEAVSKVEKMIAEGNAYIPDRYDRYRVE